MDRGEGVVSEVNTSEAKEIVNSLRVGAVPHAGLHHFATGLEPLMQVVEEELEHVATGAGSSKWIRGAYGSGKTFCTRLLCARARDKGFATSEIQISINDTPLHHLETVYRRLIERITTAADGTGAFQPIVEGWLYEVGEQVTRLQGIEEDDPAFVDAVQTKLEEKLAAISRENSAFASVLRAYHAAAERGEHHIAQRLLAWLGGEPDVPRSVLSAAGVKGKVDGTAALTFLRGLLTLLRQSDHAGLVVVLDEVETIQLMPSQTRSKSLNALRQLVDMLANGELPGLYLVVTGTPELFEGYKGLRGAQALHQRVAVRFGDGHDNLRAPQVRLQPFDAERLVEVGLRIRSMFPARNPERVLSIVDEGFVRDLVGKVVEGFGGQIAVTPRYFLRELVDIMDRVDLHETFDPRATYELHVDEDLLKPEELSARRGTPPASAEEPEEEATEDEERPKKRLDG